MWISPCFRHVDRAIIYLNLIDFIDLNKLMRSLLILATVFALLVTYLESTMTRTPDSAHLVTTSSVIRTPLPVKPPQKILNKTSVATQKNEVTAPIQASLKSPLNLKLPLVDAIKRQYAAGLAGKTQRSLLNLFKKEIKQQISYSAELVYDAEKGENITGGKVNIRIPLG